MNTSAATGFDVSDATDRCCAPLGAATVDDADATELARQFAALSDPGRIRLLSMLAASSAGELCACDLVEPLGKSQPTVSHHLKVLHEAGLVEREKRGTWVWYSLNRARVERLARFLDGDGSPPAR